VLFALIAFGTAARLSDHYSTKHSAVNFMIFTGFTGFLVAFWYLVVNFVERLQRIFSGLLEIVVNALYALWFLAAAAAIVDNSNFCKIRSEFGKSKECDYIRASAAFGFMSWLLWMGHVVPAIFDMRAGVGLLTNNSKNRGGGGA
jgi:ABC-type microcin C transport system permease subunit YejE